MGPIRHAFRIKLGIKLHHDSIARLFPAPFLSLFIPLPDHLPLQLEKSDKFLSMQGVRRPSLPHYLRVRYCMALHESGRTLVATLLRRMRLAEDLTPHLEKVERVSIVARGRCVKPV